MMVAMTGPTPAGWHPDPAGLGYWRWGDGSAWTDTVAYNGVVSQQPLPPAPAQAFSYATPAPIPDERPQLPPRAAVFVVAGIVGGILGSLAVSLTIKALAPDARLLVLLPSQLVLWSALVAACIGASRRYGTGSLRRDFGFG